MSGSGASKFSSSLHVAAGVRSDVFIRTQPNQASQSGNALGAKSEVTDDEIELIEKFVHANGWSMESLVITEDGEVFYAHSFVPELLRPAADV